MHIGFITSEFSTLKYPDNIGGITSFVKNFSSQLITEGHRVSVFVYNQSNSDIFCEDGVTIHFLQRRRVIGLTWFFNRLSFNKYVTKIVKEKKIDVLEAPEWGGFTAFMKFDCPLILRLHGSDTYFCDLEK